GSRFRNLVAWYDAELLYSWQAREGLRRDMSNTFLLRLVRSGAAIAVLVLLSSSAPASAAAPQSGGAVQQEPAHHAGGEANLVLPDLGQVAFAGVNGRTLLMGGLVVCALGLGFGLVIFNQLKNLPVHKSMLDISELIYETCKTYLITQGKFILI